MTMIHNGETWVITGLPKNKLEKWIHFARNNFPMGIETPHGIAVVTTTDTI